MQRIICFREIKCLVAMYSNNFQAVCALVKINALKTDFVIAVFQYLFSPPGRHTADMHTHTHTHTHDKQGVVVSRSVIF